MRLARLLNDVSQRLRAVWRGLLLAAAFGGAGRIRRLMLARDAAERSLRGQKRLLDVALDNMTHGIAMFDAEGRIVMFNRRYVKMMDLPASDLMGMSLLELFKIRKATGKFSGDPEAVFAKLLADNRSGRSSERIMASPNGRTLRVIDQALPEGGWVASFEDITEQLETERERDENREFLRQIIDNVPVMIAVKDAKTRKYLLANRAAEKHWHMPPECAIGRTARELFPPEQAAMIDETDDAVACADGPVTLDAHPNTPRAGRSRIVVSKRLAVRDGAGAPKYLISVVEDVTERKALETERDRDREFLRQIIDNVPVAITVRDVSTGCYALINRGAEKNLDCSRDRIVGRSVEDIWGAEMAAVISARDKDFWDAGGELAVDEHVTDMPGRGRRDVVTRRLAIWDKDGKPHYIINVVEDVTERKRSSDRIAHLAHFDALTDLPNRVLFRDKVEQAMRAGAPGIPPAVIYLDLDHFKDINDTLGHSVGDELLKTVAGRLRGCVRDGNVASRLGGDEFAVLQDPIRDRDDIVSLVGKIQDTIRAPIEVGGYRLTVDSSVGIALVPAGCTDVDQVLKYADLAMYEAKRAGRGTFRFFEPDMDARLKARRDVEFAMREAIVAGGFDIHYQPIVNLQSGRVAACEALLRWNDPKLGPVSPVEFIPIAEETGLIVQLGAWVLRTACEQAVTWPSDVKLAVNMSPVQFKNGNIIQTVVAALAASRLPANRLELEITEAVLMRDDEAALATLLQLQALGVRVAMDDFGTGYSSLGYLQRFPFDKIKVDRSFIKDIADSENSLVIVQSVVRIANSRGIATTAEGVENERQRQLLAECGCTEVQGYLFSPAVASDKIRAMLGRQSAAARAVA